ncbi:DUF4214 domain-containing protein [Halomonas sp. ANAO-440]|uniref:DUF4214 domain-containing protein n=1 Tax=Halomonas sp. ANAO-440 TaxID=2861360 RepID=UPI001CAA6F80|nr:DUF4214 domain-containing protein [Halomonas sp. ANAO-440]MBZ0329356.1 DUF4214 domain-containing protein [Halomonas sp. ANAO-440]
MALTVTEIQQLYTAYLGRPADREGLEYWQEVGVTASELRANLANDDQPEYVELYGDRTREELISAIYQNMFGREPEAEGLEYWSTGGGASVPASELQQLFIAAASPADRAAFDQRVADHEAEIPEPGVPGETFVLTEGRDNIVGTENDDTFIANVGQNQNGAISNALSTGDMLDGGAGRDQLIATMINDNEVDSGATQAPRPITKNIQEVYIEALENVTLDATRMENVEQYWSDFSRGDLTINNVNLRGDNLSITKDVTFGMRDVESEAGLTGLFESQALLREAASQVNSQLLIRIADVSTETPTTPLANVDLNLSFDLGGETVQLEGIQSTDGTYAGLVAAIENALAEAGYGDLNVELSTPYEEVTVAGNTVTLPFIAQEILVTDPAGNAFSNVNFTQSAIEPVSDGFLVAGNARPVDPAATSNLIESNLVLDNAGRGSIAGDVLIGGGSNSNVGVEQFNVAVDRDSSIASLFTTNGTLQEIHISSIGAEGSLYIGATQANLSEIDANAFSGANLSLGLGTETGVQNLSFLDAAGTSANVTFNGTNTNGTQAVLNTGGGDDNITLAQFGASSPSDASQTRSEISATGGDNTITVSGENTSVITTGAGDDTITGNGVSVTVNSGAGDDVIYAENTGQRAQVVLFGGDYDGTATINDNTVPQSQLLFGRDVQVTLAIPGMDDADGFSSGFEATASIEASNGFLTTERDLYEAVARAINDDPVLSKLAVATINSSGDLSVRYLVDGAAADGDELVQIEVLGEWEDLSSTQRNNVRDALRAEYSDSAIDATQVGNAYDATAGVETIAATGVAAEPHSFVVSAAGLDTSGTEDFVFDIDGVPSAAVSFNDLIDLDGTTVTIDGEDYTIEVDGTELTLTSTTLGELDAAPILTVSDGTDTAIGTFTDGVTGVSNGTDSVTDGVNIVNAGTGDDVIVLSSNDDTQDVVEFDAGGFGNNTIVHFNEGDTGAGSGDILDFTAWLDNEEQLAGTSTESRERFDTSYDVGGTTFSANSVVVTDFTALNSTATDFASLSGADVLSALNANFSSTAQANLVGDVQKSILFVENLDNLGEYKVFEVTSDGNESVGDSFTGAQLVGTADFGETQTFNETNFA